MKKLSLEELSKLPEEGLIKYLKNLQTLGDDELTKFASTFSIEERMGYIKIFTKYIDALREKSEIYINSEINKTMMAKHYEKFNMDYDSKLN